MQWPPSQGSLSRHGFCQASCPPIPCTPAGCRTRDKLSTISLNVLPRSVFPPTSGIVRPWLDFATLQLLNSVHPGNFRLSLIKHEFNSFRFSSSSKLQPSRCNKRFCEQLKGFVICNVKIYHGCIAFPVHLGNFKLSFINDIYIYTQFISVQFIWQAPAQSS